MRISVVITTYNRAALLRSSLQSLQQQNYERDDEVIVVDNGSTDETRKVIVAAASDFPVPLRYACESKPGKTAAPLMKYAERIFSRPAFIEALTPSEKVMRK